MLLIRARFYDFGRQELGRVSTRPVHKDETASLELFRRTKSKSDIQDSFWGTLSHPRVADAFWAVYYPHPLAAVLDETAKGIVAEMNGPANSLA
jgi:hypothetical protein